MNLYALIINASFSATILVLLLYIGCKRPSWKTELVGLLFLAVFRVLFYGVVVHEYAYPDHAHLAISTTTIASFNSMLESAVFLSYAAIWSARVKSQ